MRFAANGSRVESDFAGLQTKNRGNERRRAWVRRESNAPRRVARQLVASGGEGLVPRNGEWPETAWMSIRVAGKNKMNPYATLFVLFRWRCVNQFPAALLMPGTGGNAASRSGPIGSDDDQPLRLAGAKPAQYAGSDEASRLPLAVRRQRERPIDGPAGNAPYFLGE